METGLERVHGLSAVEPGGDGGAQTLLLDLPCLVPKWGTLWGMWRGRLLPV